MLSFTTGSNLPQREIGAEASPSPKPVPGLGLSWFAPLPPRRSDVLIRTPPTQLIHGLSALTNYRKILPAFQRSLIFSLLFHEALEFCIFLEGKPAVCWSPHPHPRSANLLSWPHMDANTSGFLSPCYDPLLGHAGVSTLATLRTGRWYGGGR